MPVDSDLHVTTPNQVDAAIPAEQVLHELLEAPYLLGVQRDVERDGPLSDEELGGRPVHGSCMRSAEGVSAGSAVGISCGATPTA